MRNKYTPYSSGRPLQNRSAVARIKSGPRAAIIHVGIKLARSTRPAHALISAYRLLWLTTTGVVFESTPRTPSRSLTDLAPNNTFLFSPSVWTPMSNLVRAFNLPNVYQSQNMCEPFLLDFVLFLLRVIVSYRAIKGNYWTGILIVYHLSRKLSALCARPCLFFTHACTTQRFTHSSRFWMSDHVRTYARRSERWNCPWSFRANTWALLQA